MFSESHCWVDEKDAESKQLQGQQKEMKIALGLQQAAPSLTELSCEIHLHRKSSAKTVH